MANFYTSEATKTMATTKKRNTLAQIKLDSLSCAAVDSKPITVDWQDVGPGDLTTELGGTLAYMAPEQTGRTNRSIDLRSDLAALAARGHGHVGEGERGIAGVGDGEKIRHIGANVHHTE